MNVEEAYKGVPEAEQCTVEGCSAAVTHDHFCLPHNRDRDAGEKMLTRLLDVEAEKRVVDLRGTTLKRSHLQVLVRELQRVGKVAELRLAGATLTTDFELENVNFLTLLDARAMHCQRRFHLKRCELGAGGFRDAVVDAFFGLTAVTVHGPLSFFQTTFKAGAVPGWSEDEPLIVEGDLVFNKATFHHGGLFIIDCRGEFDCRRAKFAGDAHFDRLWVTKEADFRGLVVDGELRLRRTRVAGLCQFSDARVDGLCDFDGALFGHLSLRRAAFATAHELGLVGVADWLILDHVVFEQAVRIRATAKRIQCQRAVFNKGVSLQLSGEVIADGTTFTQPSELTQAPATGHQPAEEGEIRTVEPGPVTSAEIPESAPPIVLSLRGADVEGLALSRVDLSRCLLAGAHRLDQLRIGARVVFARTPKGWWTPRDVIAEERWWRARHHKRRGPKWAAAHLELADFKFRLPPPDIGTNRVEAPVPLGPHEVAELYRALRKAREDAKDAPGASDFYYGEMEMRRKALAGRGLKTLEDVRRFADRGVLGAYWMLSGYGLRAWRSATLLVALVTAAAIAFDCWGYEEDVSQERASRFAIASATSLLRPLKDDGLTTFGFGLEMFLRLAGPVLIGLTLLALRARVKR